MGRLLINPGTPQAWEIQLKPGINRIGRGEDNDFTVRDNSVSTWHCEIVLDGNGALFRDLDSTNGSFVDRVRVTEMRIMPGQRLQLGTVDMIYESTPVTSTSVTAPPLDPAIKLPPPPQTQPAGGLHIARTIADGGGTAFVTAGSFPPPVLPAELDVRDAFCRSHPKSPARFHCPKCRHYFCDLCVATRTAGKFCRHCGGLCTPVRVHITPPKEERLGFFGRLPEAFAYPFRGSGMFMLFGGTILYVILHICPILFLVGGIWLKTAGLMGMVTVGGYLAAFFQSIIHTTAAGDKEMPSMPAVTNLWEDVLVPAFQFSGVWWACFGPMLVFGVMAAVSDSVLAKIVWMPLGLAGLLYFPMAYLAVVTFDTIKALNPMIVVKSILNVPLEYLATLGLLVGVMVLDAMGYSVMGFVIEQGFLTASIKKFFMMMGIFLVLVLFEFYLATVSVRVLGLLFVTKRERLGWFSR